MKIRTLINQISIASRSKDWRLSFVPFIMGCVYLWFNFFNLTFSFYHLAILALSIVTTFGFAALGYFINEYFDQKEDLLAGKINKLSVISVSYKFFLLFGILLITFLPWMYLPKNSKSYYLIVLEILCFFIYSFPLLRYKKNIFLAGVLDASYAYLIPSLLSFHTFSLISTAYNNDKNYLLLFFVLLFFIGYRNILIHQVNDAINDQKAGVKTLVHYLGPQKSNNFLKTLYFIEISLLIASAVAFFQTKLVFGIWILFVSIFLYTTRREWIKILTADPYIILKKERHCIDLLYQLWFPVSQLLILLFIDWRWVFILPIHALVFVKKDYLIAFWQSFKNYVWHKSLRPFFSFLVNNCIYYTFRLVGIDLKKEKKSAIEIIKSKFDLK